MKARALLLGVLGLVIITALLAWKGFDHVLGAVAGAGWGVLLVALFHVVPMVFDTAGWAVLLGRDIRPRFSALLRRRWISESVNGLLPVAQVGGELIRIRLLTHRRVEGALAAASVVVDVTLGFTMQLLFALFGAALLARYTEDVALSRGLMIAIGVGLVLMTVFYIAQHGGLFLFLAHGIERMLGARSWMNFVGGARALDAKISELWRHRGRILGCATLRFTGWVVGAGEVYLALWFLDAPITIEEALIIESLAQAARSAGFAIPAALGIQEGGYLLAGEVLGIGSETALALALVRRTREVLLGVPGLAVWQLTEGRRLLRGRRAQKRRGSAARARQLEEAEV